MREMRCVFEKIKAKDKGQVEGCWQNIRCSIWIFGQYLFSRNPSPRNGGKKKEFQFFLTLFCLFNNEMKFIKK